MKKPIHISIYGSCVTRDTFVIVKDLKEYDAENETEYVIDKYIQSVSPLSAISEKPSDDKIKELIKNAENVNGINFYKKMFCLDINKGWYDYLSEIKSEWLLIDLTCARYKLIKHSSETDSTKNLYYSHDIVKYIYDNSDKTKNKAVVDLFNGEIVDTSLLDLEQLKQLYFEFFKQVLKLYPQEKIIIVKAKHVFSYLNKNGDILSENYSSTNSNEKENALIDFAYKCIEEYMPNAHYIENLPILIGNVNHKWGQCGLHYVDDVYLYMYRCIDFIINNSDNVSKDEENLYLAKELIKFSNKISENYQKAVSYNLDKERNIINLEHGTTVGSYDKSGINLIINQDYSFALKGTALEDVVFYLYSESKKPDGDWKSAKQTFLPGEYLFSTKIKSKNQDFFIQLVLTDEKIQRKWIFGNLSTKFSINQRYDYFLIRVVIKKGISVDEKGNISLQYLKK